MSEHVAIDQDALQEINLGQYFRATAQGLIVIGRPSIDAFAALGETLRTLDRSIQFVIGDYFREVEDRFHEKSSQLLDHTGWSEQTLKTYRWTAKQVPSENRRMDVLSYSHHQAVAALPIARQKELLDKSADGDGTKPWSVQRLKAEITSTTTGTPMTFGVSVFCESEADQEACCRQLDNLGRRYRPFASGAAKKVEAAT